MSEVYRRKIKQVISNGTASHKIAFSPNKRVFAAQLELVFPAGTGYDTMAECMAAITSIRLMAGSKNLWGDKLTGTKLRDALLLFGTAYDFNINTSTNTVQLTIPFAPEWFLENVQDLLALNPARLGVLSLEIDFTAGIAVTTTAWEFIADDLGAPSAGYITFDVVRTKASGTEFTVSQPEIKPEGSLLWLSVYPDSTNSREITPVSFQYGPDNAYAHQEVSSVQNDEELERKGLTPAASGRTANVYDFVPVKGDQLSRAIDLAAWKNTVLTIGAAAAMDGTSDILIARLMPNRN